jgi:chemotaxis protein histidine kinase CheA
LLDDDVVTVPAGWYPDPMGLPQLRWWDNHSWTEFTSAARTPLIVQDEPRLAYADDDLPSRRSQREQRTATGGAQQAPMSKAELMSTLRELEPPKPQQIERSQPAPSFAPSPADEAEAARLQAEQQRAAEQAAQRQAQQRAAEQQAAQQRAAQQQAYQAQQQRAAQEQQAYQAPQGFQNPQGFPSAPQGAPAADPFADFIRPSEDPRPARSSVNYDAPGFQQQAPEPGAYAYNDPAAQHAYAREYSRSAQRRLDRSQIIYTPFVWALAMIPMVQMIIILLSVSSGAQTVPIAVPIAIQVVPYLAAIVVAYFDRRALLAAGHTKPAHWALAFLTTPVYLIARAVATNREFGKGLSPIFVWLSLGVLQLLSIIAVPGILISAMPQVFQDQVEQSIAQDAAIVGTTLDVSCPSPAVQIGVQFTCLGTTETGNTVEINVSLQRANGWIDWRVDSQIWQSGALN